MEKRLNKLIEQGNDKNKTKWALEWKKQGRKVVGTVCSPMMEEVIYSAGMLPCLLKGLSKQNISPADMYRPDYTCSYCTHILGSLLAGEYDFLDGLVFLDRDQDLVRLWDVWIYLEKMNITPMLHIPKQQTELAYQQFVKEILKLINILEKLEKITISISTLNRTISMFNERQALIFKLYELRKREIPPLTGTEFMGVTNAATVMPVDEFNLELKSLIPYIETRKATKNPVHPRLLVTGDMIDNPSFLKLVEDSGCLIAMDDTDIGSRYFIPKIDNTGENPVYSLAKHYVNINSGLSRSNYWDRQVNQVIKWCDDYKINGVIGLYNRGCFPRMWREPYFIKKTKESGIPYLSIEKTYDFSNVGQLRTRIGAFLEMIETNS